MFFANFKETADKLPDDLRLKFYDAMTDYVFNGKEPEDTLINALITAIKPSLNKEDFRGGIRDGAGRPKSNEIKDNQKESKQSNEIKHNQNNQSFLETETETETRNKKLEVEKEKEKEKVAIAPPRFQKPTIEQIKTYSEDQGYVLDAQAFWDFYESKGWKVGNQGMKDWQAAVRNWVRKDRQHFGSDNTKSRQKIAFEKAYNNLQALYQDDVLEVANAG